MTEPETTSRSTIARWVIGLLVLLLVLLITALMAVCMLALLWRVVLGPAPDYPSDEEMIARYMANKAAFEQLADMMIAEQEIAWVLDGQCELKDQRIVTGDENEQCRAYLKLCRDLEIELIATGEEPFTLYVGSRGGAMGGSVLGYEYTSEPPSTGLVDDTRQRGDEWAGGTAYHHIEGNWYIFLWDG